MFDVSFSAVYSGLSVNRKSLIRNCCLNGSTAPNMMDSLLECCNPVHSVNGTPVK